MLSGVLFVFYFKGFNGTEERARRGLFNPTKLTNMELYGVQKAIETGRIELLARAHVRLTEELERLKLLLGMSMDLVWTPDLGGALSGARAGSPSGTGSSLRSSETSQAS